jgi:hypothetical protein
MIGFLWAMRPYYRQVAGQLVLGSLAGIVMNTAVVLPAEPRSAAPQPTPHSNPQRATK